MLSRANSDAALRLRRAKSSSSSSHRPFEPSILNEPKYAEAAAVEAYTRAYRYSQGDRPQRRRSRRSEGSHFDDNRRKSTQKPERFERPALVPGPATAPATIPVRPLTRQSLLPDTPYRFALEASNDPIVTMTDMSESRLSTASRRQTRDLQTDDEIKTAAWDAYLQGFHKKEVRERKSFAAPLRKRFSKSPTPAPSIHYDTSVPPYNCVEESNDVFSTTPPIEIKPEGQPEAPAKLKKQWTVSESLKGRFKRLLSRPKRVQSHFPAQHVEARNLHFDVYKTNDDSFSGGPDFGVSLPRSPFSSLGASSGAQSRITSWSNSTNSRGKRLPSIDETSAPPALASTPEEAPTGSFLGRALRLPLCRPSQTNLQRKSEDSKRLYDALQRRINGPEVPTIVVEEVASQPPAVVFNNSPPISPASETIRMVTPEPTIPESPTRPAPSPPHQVARKSSWWSIAPSIRSKKRRPAEPVAPSNEQIAARVERSENRWQAALEDGSPVVSRALNYCMKGDNPYELRPLENVNDSSLPAAVRHESHDAAAPTFDNGADLHDLRQQVISPSIYSRSVSPDAVGTFITITGREVKRYPLDSPPRPVNGPATYTPKPSNEWRAWFSKEIEDFSMTPAPIRDTVLAGPDYSLSNDNPYSSKESLQEDPPVLQASKSRPQLRSRSSSIMNERYPLIDTGRPSSRASGRRTNPSSTSSGQRSASGSGTSVAERASSKASQRGDADQSMMSSSVVRERQSTSALVRKKSSLATRAARHGYGPSTNEIESAGRDSPVKAPKSSLDLRVMYRNNRNLEASSINIRRRAVAPTAFDDTLRRISEGPYAADSKENTAPPRPSGMIDGITIPPFYTPTKDSSKSKGSSPGQRMVDEFLNSRKTQMVKNSPPAFI
ncbi:unnamed protein product [Aureobasidium uvarum]|uniref:Uncharacterized protein n=1 Tax=Aureobasidium uvarum TaxID=2773716 RepID=A0A9N8PVJ2_9PEZI|nr:unnamed protein product [Aureobasidium uvarum]